MHQEYKTEGFSTVTIVLLEYLIFLFKKTRFTISSLLKIELAVKFWDFKMTMLSHESLNFEEKS